ncbi:MAG: glycosyl hydrolase family protein [Candidatus Sulfotelmatobacter sp.]|nr:glycosyl hydrolase family protein [Candidatus Sulfotelmatobacter sp.]
MKFVHSSAFISALMIILPVFLAAQDSAPLAHHVSGNVPIQAWPSSHSLSAERPVIAAAPVAQPQVAGPSAHNWQLQATLPNAIIHDLSFASPTIGYAAAELGQVWKTSDGGASWSEILNLGFPYYFYGVSALTADKVVISGFNDSAGTGIIRWTYDGGQTWSADIVTSSVSWGQRVRFPNSNDGLILDLFGNSSGNLAQYTKTGGATAADWASTVDDPSGGWFGLQFSLLPNLHARASGVHFCKSPNAGASWSCGHSIDSVFDGPVFFLNDTYGWVGGGEISPNVEGWIHVTANGGKTWSGRTLDGPWPIREILFLTAKSGWAAGGNLYSGVGGIYFTNNGGKTWSVDVTTNAEMDACAKQPTNPGYRVWCAGYDGSLNGVIYSLNIP